jgi:hypothetical protein
MPWPMVFNDFSPVKPVLAWRPRTERPNAMHFQRSERGLEQVTWIVNVYCGATARARSAPAYFSGPVQYCKDRILDR